MGLAGGARRLSFGFLREVVVLRSVPFRNGVLSHTGSAPNQRQRAHPHPLSCALIRKRKKGRKTKSTQRSAQPSAQAARRAPHSHSHSAQAASTDVTSEAAACRAAAGVSAPSRASARPRVRPVCVSAWHSTSTSDVCWKGAIRIDWKLSVTDGAPRGAACKRAYGKFLWRVRKVTAESAR